MSYRKEMVRDQAIYSIYDKDIQAKILAKGTKLLNLEAMLMQAEAEEQAKITQGKLEDVTAEVKKMTDFNQMKKDELLPSQGS